jgi:hypothetical protein
MTSKPWSALSIDRTKLKYTIFYYPGTGGHIIGWLLGLAYDYRLLKTALDCFPADLKNNPRSIRDENHVVESGWCLHENVQQLNPYIKLIFLGPSTEYKYWPIRGVKTELSYGPEIPLPSIKLGTDGGQRPTELHAINKVVKLSNVHTKSVFLIMSPSARMRACYEKGVRPWRTYDTPTLGSVKHEMINNRMAQEDLLDFIPIDYYFNFNDVYNNKYIKVIESMIDHPLTDAHVEAIEKLVNRYIHITPPKLQKMIDDENKLS